MFHYSVNADSSIPIYRQLVDQINAQIRSGALKTGAQLPTVREMADKLHLSLGTVKRAYDCLQEMGDIEMTRRRGTFVKYVHRDRDSRKHQAMVAIDQMVRKLTELHFSPAEIQIFLNLKMREWGLKWTGVRVTVVTECPEIAPALKSQLEDMPNVQCTVYPLRQLQEYPYSVDEQSDLILSTAGDEHKILHLLPDGEKFVRAAFAADMGSAVALASCRGTKLCVLCESRQFADLVKKCLPADEKKQLVCITDLEACPADVDALVVPKGMAYSPEVRLQIDAFAASRPVLEFAWRLGEGSMLYLEERIGKMRDERQQWPAAMRL